jgi:hypothetical protein
MSLFFFMLVLREYRGFGKVPQRADLATVIPPPDMHGIWMEVTQPLIVHCEPVETEYPHPISKYFSAEWTAPISSRRFRDPSGSQFWNTTNKQLATTCSVRRSRAC